MRLGWLLVLSYLGTLTHPLLDLLTTYSVQLRATLLATGPFISAFPASILRVKADELSLKILPVELPFRPWPFAAVTLKNRTVNPAVARFIDHVRAFTRPMAAELNVQ